MAGQGQKTENIYLAHVCGYIDNDYRAPFRLWLLIVFPVKTMRVCLGGTFDILHGGHKALLSRAFEVGDSVFIGLTSDSMARQKGDLLNSYLQRKKNLIEYIASKFNGEFVIEEINDVFGPTLAIDFDAIIVSEETKENADRINDKRRDVGKEPFQIVIVDMVVNAHGQIIRTSAIKRGDM